MKISRPRGTRDFLPENTRLRRFVENRMRDVVSRWGYSEIITPTFENLELFTLKSGEGVTGEIYNFSDKGDRELALRPELTAPVMRMYVNEMQATPRPLKLFYFENCFRYERPQKGRFREFWQFGVETIGSSRPDADAEVIALAEEMIESVGIKGDLHVGHLGIIRHILEELEPEQQTKIMRLVDKKDDTGLDDYLEQINASIELRNELFELVSITGDDAIEKARQIVGDIEELQIFEELTQILDAYNVEYSVDFGIARGLDYYTGMVFEIYASNLGAQNQICGGGSYQLIQLFGGGDVPSTGFGLGFDRIMEICELEPEQKKEVVLVATDDTRLDAIGIARELRRKVPVYLDIMKRNFKGQLSHANNIGARYVVIVGKREMEAGKVTLKDMESGEQHQLTVEEAREHILKSGM
ncbi:histidine--tRNA ligase [Methanohalophilus portucalensis]|uniref:Histidine--tRNA ligase n=2 Tax=Methanohalophilus portucalensis TaxID=39664 RepID=A0A1L9C4I6_9EURY|nr:histidine--tRNA ligase [Methanohalophilus portucalensis]ATU07748.1 histidine--tRNA ligase [Methanohalophilus portucalensis]OJH49442.1 histidyl-tRNA synthetase [Methanohalophilus portucalensis FDF-1]RNI11461.1 histidine--tRNA ligase [Methanohalophilus portucalensis FDF-1]SMH40926.1 histidyl-tRNA synthetase [Methanohalophilus portucalensis FDF-1]